MFGIMDVSMSYDEGYFFWCFGVVLEWVDMILRIIDVCLLIFIEDMSDLLFENILWMSVFRSLSGY